jgi:hypothetical protein
MAVDLALPVTAAAAAISIPRTTCIKSYVLLDPYAVTCSASMQQLAAAHCDEMLMANLKD